MRFTTGPLWSKWPIHAIEPPDSAGLASSEAGTAGGAGDGGAAGGGVHMCAP